MNQHYDVHYSRRHHLGRSFLVAVLGWWIFHAVPANAQDEPKDQTTANTPAVNEPLPSLPGPAKAAPPKDKLSSEIEADEPAVYQKEGQSFRHKALELQKVEEKPAVLMEKDRPDFIPLFFDPEKNGVIYGHQEIEYDLTNPLILRVGPLAVTAAGAVMRMSRETGQFFEFEFGLDLQKRFANMYMISFQWPVDLIPDGVIELFNDQGKVLWRREVDEEQVADWQKFVKATETQMALEAESAAKDKAAKDKGRPNVTFDRLKITGHDQSSFGLFGKQIFEIPVWQITEPFRFCVTKDSPEGRIALCSKRYHFTRAGGRYWVVAESKNVMPKVFVNDKPVTLKGSAVFIDDKKPIKFSALMGNGTYFEFVSFPKRITIVDMVLNEETKQIEAIGYGAPPIGPIDRIERRGGDYWDFLNFMPTIGDFRKFWKATFPVDTASLFLRGYGGAPFKQPFIFDRLPRRTIRPLIHNKSPRSTYAQTVTVRGETKEPAQVTSKELEAKNLTPNSFEWEFLARQRGEMNQSEILVQDGKYTYHAFHDIYKGYPRELGLRMTGVLSNNLQIVLMGEVAGQWWFEKLLWWDNPKWSHQRWGVAAKYFKALAAVGGNRGAQSLIKLEVANVDLKYRLTQGIWGRDHTLGLMLDAQDVIIEHFRAQMGGVGVFWARSMPKIFDQIFNIIPFLRYPKWVDAESIFYVMPLSTYNRLGINTAFNFHGKILWTDRFYGEAGFGVKIYQFDDMRERKQIALGLAYGTVGLGYNF